MDTGERLGLVLLYIVIAGYAVLMLRIFVQVLFRALIEGRRRRQFTEKNGGAAYTPRAFVGKRGWANRWLPRNPEIIQPTLDGNSAGKLPGAAPIVKQAIALVSILIAFGLACSVAAQQRTGSEVPASTLKQQLLDLESKETRVRMRLEELNEQLKPESIERELAGIGSTHPEELREHRRKLLTIERNGLQTQLDLLEQERARIEAAISATETQAAPSEPMPQMSIRESRLGNLPLEKLLVAIAMMPPLTSGLILLLIVALQKFDQWGRLNKSAQAAVSKLIVLASSTRRRPTGRLR